MTELQNNSGDSKMKFSGVFKSLVSVKACLQNEKYFNLPEVKELLKLFNDNYAVAQKEVLDRSQRKVFIVLEGIDCSGKTTISKRLSKLICGQQLGTPPPQFLNLREKFDSHEMELRRAYYALGNYLVAQQVKEIYRTEPVIMDRFWHSTAAYAIAQQVVDQNGTVPLEGDDIYEWPSDLLKPDIVFFLSVSESKRLDRLMRRKSKPITREELKLKDNKPLREALEIAYKRMKNPPQLLIDSDVVIEEVLVQIRNILQEVFQIQLPEIESYIPENEKP